MSNSDVGTRTSGSEPTLRPGNRPAVIDGTNTTGHSRPFAPCTVEMETASTSTSGSPSNAPAGVVERGEHVVIDNGDRPDVDSEADQQIDQQFTVDQVDRFVRAGAAA